ATFTAGLRHAAVGRSYTDVLTNHHPGKCDGEWQGAGSFLSREQQGMGQLVTADHGGQPAFGSLLADHILELHTGKCILFRKSRQNQLPIKASFTGWPSSLSLLLLFLNPCRIQAATIRNRNRMDIGG